MASMWKFVGRKSLFNDVPRLLYQYSCRECLHNRSTVSATASFVNYPYNCDHIQIRHYSDGRKAFFQSIYDNVKEGFSKDKKLNENLKKFREEKEKLEKSDALKDARKKFENIEAESSKSSDALKKGFEDVKGKVSEKFDEVQKTEFVRKSIEIGQEIGKTAGKAGDVVLEQGKKIGQSDAIQKSARALREEFEEAALSRGQIYKAPEILSMRSMPTDPSETKIYEADDNTTTIAVHKDAKWQETWSNFKDNNLYVNKMFAMKTKFDESENIAIRATRVVTDKIQDTVAGMFKPNEMSLVMTEISKMDPNFDTEKFLKRCQCFIIPNVLEAINRGDEEVLKDWCHEVAFSVLMQPVTQCKTMALKYESKVLDVGNVELAAGKIMETGPALIIQFTSQIIKVVRNTKGDVVEGDPEKVLRVTNIWALCRDQEELDPRAAWRVMECVSSEQDQFI